MICTICLNILIEGDIEVHSTPCGHVFHSHCLMKWLNGSSTCPQCRKKTTIKDIIRIYFTLASAENITEDAVSLQCKVDTLKFKVRTQEKDISNLYEKLKKYKAQSQKLLQEVRDLEKERRSTDSVILSLKDQIVFYKSRSKEMEKLNEELFQVRQRVKDLENIQQVIDSNTEDLSHIFKDENNLESLKLMAMMLKKSLLDTQKKNKEIDLRMKKYQHEVNQYKKDNASLGTVIDELRQELESCKKTFYQEKEYLKTHIKRKILDPEDSFNERVFSESPIPVKRQRNDPQPTTTTDNATEPTENSPYLQLKSSSVGLDPLLYKRNEKEFIKRNVSSKSSGRKSVTLNIYLDDSPSTPKDTTEKRPKTTSGLSKLKYRKLAPNPN